MARRKREQTIFFPWERRDSLLLAVPWLRSRALFAGLFMIVLLVLFGMRQRGEIGVRSTRARILVVREALNAYRADNEGKCPGALEDLKKEGYLKVDPIDAWGRPLVLICPGRRNPGSYDLVSFGASGDMRGLDRVE